MRPDRTLMAVPFSGGVPGAPVPLFKLPRNDLSPPYSVTADNQFLVLVPDTEGTNADHINVVLNWRAIRTQ